MVSTKYFSLYGLSLSILKNIFIFQWDCWSASNNFNLHLEIAFFCSSNHCGPLHDTKTSKFFSHNFSQCKSEKLIQTLCCIIFYLERTSYKRFSKNLTLGSPNCLENFSIFMLHMGVLKCWKIIEFLKISIKIKIVKYFTRSKQQATLRKSFCLNPNQLPLDKILLNFWNKMSYRDTQTFPFKVLQ